MPKLPCPCGYVHDLSPIPDAGWLTVSDRDYDRLVELHNDRDTLSAAIWGRLYGCPKCGRLRWRQNWGDEYKTWTPAEPMTVGEVDERTALTDALEKFVDALVETDAGQQILARVEQQAFADRLDLSLHPPYLNQPQNQSNYLGHEVG